MIRRLLLPCMAAALVFGTQAMDAGAADAPAKFSLASVAAAPVERIDDVYQWSLAMPSPDYERRAYLWVPPRCRHVKGVVIGLQNMLEKLLFQNGDFRDACAAADVAIVYIAPGSVSIDKDKEPALSLGFKDLKAGVAQLNKLLNDLAAMSGYTEIATAPIIPVSHSAATPFGYGVAYADTDRCIAFIPYKGWFSGVKGGLPIFHVSSEWAEVGGKDWGQTWANKDRPSVLKLRASKSDPEVSEYVEIGNGHFAWQPNSGKILGMFVRKVVAARVSNDGSDTLKPLPIESGVLVNPTDLEKPRFKSYPYSKYPGDKKAAYWYIDAEMAQTVHDYMAPRLAKKPQVVDVLVKGVPAPLDKGGAADMGVTLMPDGVSWKVDPIYLDTAPPQLAFGNQPLGHAEAPVYFRVTSGAIKQTGINTFRVWLGRGGIERQGDPWDPWAIATSPGDSRYRSADRPVHFWVSIRSKTGTPQTITFPDVPSVPAGTQSMNLRATASSGLPVQYYMVSGPARVSDTGVVTFEPIPPRSKFPVKVSVGAFQWGHGIDPKIASAEPVVKEFEITGPSKD